MYLGSTDAGGLHHLLFELVNETLDPLASQPANAVRVALYANGSAEVRDNGSPPNDLEAAFGAIHPGSHGILSRPTANALSEELAASARTPGSVAQCTFRRGQLHAAMQFGGPDDDRGLTVRFKPDPGIFGAAQFDPNTVRDRLRQCAFLNSGVRITFADEANGTEDVFEYADGVAEYVKWLNVDRSPLHAEVITFAGIADGIDYEIGLQWCAEDELLLSFANSYHTRNGGTHLNGVRTAVRDTVRNLFAETVPGEIATPDDRRAGLTAVVSVRLDTPYYTGATRDQLGNREVERTLAAVLTPGLAQYFGEHPDAAKIITQRALLECDVREATRAARRDTRKRK